MSEVVLPHAIEHPSESTWRARVTRYKYRQSALKDTAVFQKIYANQSLNCVVGSEVDGTNNSYRVTGADKYEQGRFDVYVAAILLKLFPEGHDNLMLSVAHPSDAIPYLDMMIKTIQGKHSLVLPDGSKVNYNIRAVAPFDESSGGVIRALTNEYAAYNPYDLTPGMKVLTVDIGGKISSMTPAILMDNNEVHPLFDDAVTFELGIQDIESALDIELRSHHPELFRRSVPKPIINQIILSSGRAIVGGDPYDFSEIFWLAANPLLTQIENIYITQMKKALEVVHFYGTGGGCGLLESTLKNEIFQGRSFSLADNAKSIHLANARGGYYALCQYVEANRSQALRRLTEKSTPLAFATIDAGNTNGKGIS